MHRAAAGEEGLGLLAHEEIVRIVEPVADQAAVDRVVVGEVTRSSTGFRALGDLDGRAVAVPHPEEFEVFEAGMIAMQMEVGAQCFRGHSLLARPERTGTNQYKGRP
jgi:hypothetical protein